MKSSPLATFVLALSILGLKAAQTEPVNLHAANAAEAADVAEQAATVAKRVASHTEEVAHHTAEALRFTRDALKRAGASAGDVAEVGRQADQLDEEAGITSGEGQEGRRQSSEMKEERSQISRSGDVSSDASSHGRNGLGGSGHASGSGISADGSSSVGRDSEDHNSGSASSSSGSSGSSSSEGVSRRFDIDNSISPYPNGVEPFGQEDPARELTSDSVKQSDGMIDQIENTQGIESKRAVYRALTKLRGATIASYDGMAKAHLKNVDRYNKAHKWRDDHPVRHLAEEEDDTHVWAFPKKTSKTKKASKIPPPVVGVVAAPAPAAAK